LQAAKTSELSTLRLFFFSFFLFHPCRLRTLILRILNFETFIKVSKFRVLLDPDDQWRRSRTGEGKSTDSGGGPRARGKGAWAGMREDKGREKNKRRGNAGGTSQRTAGRAWGGRE
jgi:hypothetical protein